MGYFSFTCAKTGLPIVSEDSGAGPKHCDVVLLEHDNTTTRGSYDGYGRVGGERPESDIGGPTGAKLILACFYKGERYDQLGDSKHDPEQGLFDPIFHVAMMRAQELVPGFDGHQYIPRLRELHDVQAARDDFFEARHGFSVSSLWDLRQSVERLDYEESVERAAAAERIWNEATKAFPNGELPCGHLAYGENFEEAQIVLDAECERLKMAYVTELVEAWCEGRLTRVPNFEALASGLGQAWLPRISAAAPEDVTRRPRFR